ncbi:hypothetical protein LEN26_001022 [Aphanomyces euteiches]|nr:hypothetical protein LEN26_001022 [Aphanomyces euteiches]
MQKDLSDGRAGGTKKKRRKGQAQRMANYRMEKKKELEMLQLTIGKLEQIKRQMTTTCGSDARTHILPWREVATALMESLRDSHTSHDELFTAVQKTHDLIRDMKLWVAANTPIEASPNPRQRSWRNFSLMANPESRRQGKEWIVQQMYYNADYMFEQYKFPSMDSEEVIDLDLQISANADFGYLGVFRSLEVMSISLEDFVSIVKNTIFSIQFFVLDYTPDMPLAIHEVDGRTIQLAIATPRKEFVNILFGEFHTEDRTVVVMQQIQQDETCQPVNHRQRNRMSWYDVRRLPGNRIKRRLLVLDLPVESEDFPVDLDQDARDHGLTLSGVPDHLKESRLARQMKLNALNRIEQSISLLGGLVQSQVKGEPNTDAPWRAATVKSD